jgi:lipopolysaccharide biosynthesis protein
MATHWGNEGVVKIGAATVAEVTAFNFKESVSPVDDTSMGDSYKTHIAGSGIKQWSGSLTAHWDETDATGQVALTVGASVTLNLYPEGATTGDIFWSGLVSITDRSQDQKMDGSTITAEFEFMGNGVLTRGTVP